MKLTKVNISNRRTYTIGVGLINPFITLYAENIKGEWGTSEYDRNGNEIYHETSKYGVHLDRRNETY